MTGLPSYGKQTVAILSSELAASGDWRNASKEDVEAMKEELESKRQLKLKRVSEKMVGREIDSTMSVVESMVCKSSDILMFTNPVVGA